MYWNLVPFYLQKKEHPFKNNESISFFWNVFHKSDKKTAKTSNEIAESNIITVNL